MTDPMREAALAGSKARFDAFGVTVLFRGQAIKAMVTARQPDLDLESGGFQERATWSVRFPASVQPVPKLREKIVEVATDRTMYITGVVEAVGENTVAVEHVVEAQKA